MTVPMQAERRAFTSPLYFQLLSTLALILVLLAVSPLRHAPPQTAEGWLILGGVVGPFVIACLFAWLALNRERAHRLAYAWRSHPLLNMSLGALVVVGGLLGWVATANVRWAWGVLPQMAWLALVIVLLLALVFSGQPHAKLPIIAGQVILVLVCTLLTGLILDRALRAYPALVPQSAWAHLRDPGLRLRAYYDFFDRPLRMGYRYRPNRAEWLPARNTGLPPFRVRFITDENGFRNTPPLAEHYAVVATGDSFTAGDFVDDAWPVLLEQLSGLPTLNLSVRGWGPQAEAEAVKSFGLPTQPDWVIVGYYEGNDLRDAAIYEQVRASGLDWVEWARSVVTRQPLDSWLVWQSLRYGLHDFLARWFGSNTETAQTRRFPLQVQIGEHTINIGFYDDQTSYLSASGDDITASVNYALTETALRDLKAACEAQGSHLLIAYLPSKEHVYLPLIEDPEVLSVVLSGARPVVLGEDGYLTMGEPPLPPQTLWANLDDQRQVIATLAAQLDADFLDLTPAFQAGAAEGQDLYFPINAHWTQEGQRLAAEIIAAYLSGQTFVGRSPMHD